MTLNSFELSLSSRWVTKGKIACRALVPDLIQALARLERLRLLLQTACKVRLQPVVREDWSLKHLKEFCEGVLDGGFRHEWRASLLQQHACRRSRVTVASSLFLFRKILPKPMSAKERSLAEKRYIEKMTTPGPDLDPSFRDFCRTETARIFRHGWDSGWQSFVENFTLPTRSCLEAGRSKGGPRGLNRGQLRADYSAFAAEGKVVSLCRKTELMTIWTGGKWRLVTKFAAKRSFLSPLHRLIYSRLSKSKWLLRGEATHDRFSEFVRKEGEVFVSGDYESATDNLNIELTKLMLDVMSQSSTNVPHAVWDQAKSCLVNVFPNGREQARGQLMGSLLSFPLLCLANYLTFRYAIPRRCVPVKINGDDIVFRCTPGEKERWFEMVEKSGLVVSRGKTLVLRGGFSLNSTFFLSRYQGVDECPVIRSTCLFGGVEDPNAIAGRLRGVYRGGGVAGEQIRSLALREMSKQIWRSQRSVRRGLGAMVSWRSLAWAGLEKREVFYNSLTQERCLPFKKALWTQNALPEGYQRVPAGAQSKDDPDFFREMIQCCWTRDPLVGDRGSADEYWKAVREDTFTYVPPCEKRFARMAGMSVDEYETYLRRRVNTSRPIKMVWAKVPRGVAFCGSS